MNAEHLPVLLPVIFPPSHLLVFPPSPLFFHPSHNIPCCPHSPPLSVFNPPIVSPPPPLPLPLGVQTDLRSVSATRGVPRYAHIHTHTHTERCRHTPTHTDADALIYTCRHTFTYPFAFPPLHAHEVVGTSSHHAHGHTHTLACVLLLSSDLTLTRIPLNDVTLQPSLDMESLFAFASFVFASLSDLLNCKLPYTRYTL